MGGWSRSEQRRQLRRLRQEGIGNQIDAGADRAEILSEAGRTFLAGRSRKVGDRDFTDCHRRLTEAGKPKKLIRVALARKLLVRLNAKARDARCQFANPA